MFASSLAGEETTRERKRSSVASSLVAAPPSGGTSFPLSPGGIAFANAPKSHVEVPRLELSKDKIPPIPEVTLTSKEGGGSSSKEKGNIKTGIDILSHSPRSAFSSRLSHQSSSSTTPRSTQTNVSFNAR